MGIIPDRGIVAHVQVAEWLGRRINRAHAFKFLGSPSDIPLGRRSQQTLEHLDADNPDGDPGPWVCGKNSLLLGPTTAQLNRTGQAQRMLWDQADRAVHAAQDQQRQKVANVDAPVEEPPGASLAPNTDTVAGAARDVDAALVSAAAGPPHGMPLLT